MEVSMSNSINWILIIVGAVLVLLEVLLGAISGFDFLLLGSAILIGGVLGLFTGNGIAGLTAAGTLSLLYVFVGRKRIRNRLKRPSLPSNTDALIGRTALVTETITNDRPGRIKSEGEEWRAHIAGSHQGPFTVGRKVVVSRIDGVTAFVSPAEEADPSAGVTR
jgi:membrane protein implicated in regulation of membrane protease activity